MIYRLDRRMNEFVLTAGDSMRRGFTLIGDTLQHMAFNVNENANNITREVTIDVRYEVDDIGPLISTFAQPWHLMEISEDVERSEQGTLKISVERTHEWEQEIGLLILGGSAVYAKSLLQALGNRMGHWIADRIADREQSGEELTITIEIEHKNGENLERLEIPTEEGALGEFLSEVLTKASDREGKVIVDFS